MHEECTTNKQNEESNDKSVLKWITEGGGGGGGGTIRQEMEPCVSLGMINMLCVCVCVCVCVC